MVSSRARKISGRSTAVASQDQVSCELGGEAAILNSEGTLKVAKKPYVPPQLTAYGNVEKLTQGGHGSGTDKGSMMKCL